MSGSVAIVANAKTPDLPTLLGCVLDRVLVMGSPEFYGPLNKNIQWVPCSTGHIAGWATGILKISPRIPDRLVLASDTFDVLFPEAFMATLGRHHAPGFWTFAGPQQYIGDLVCFEGRDVVSRVLTFFRERSLDDYVGHPPASVFVDFDVGLPMTLKNAGITWTALHPTRILRSLASPLESSPVASQDPMTECWDRLLMDGCPILKRQRRAYPGDSGFLERFLKNPCGKDTKVIVPYVPRELVQPIRATVGFVVLGPDKDGACLASIRDYYPFAPIMIQSDSKHPGTIPYTGNAYLALIQRNAFQKAVVIPDSVSVTRNLDDAIASVKTAAFLWHYEKHAATVHLRHAMQFIKPKVRLSVQHLHDKGPWMGCFSCATISDVHFLKTLDDTYGLFSNAIPAIAYERLMSVVFQHAHQRVMYGLFGNLKNKSQYPMTTRLMSETARPGTASSRMALIPMTS
jgi:hypothetical protein